MTTSLNDPTALYSSMIVIEGPFHVNEAITRPSDVKSQRIR